LPQILHDEFLVGKEVLVVAGTHGKTSTTSMLAWIFETAGLRHRFLIGGIAENFGSSFGLSEGRYFILEGDEYDTAFFDKGPKFLHYFPDAIILTSVEFDHADIYKDLDAVETAIQAFAEPDPAPGKSHCVSTPARASSAAWNGRSVRSNATVPQIAPPGRSRISNSEPTELHGRCCAKESLGPISNSRWPVNTTSGTPPRRSPGCGLWSPKGSDCRCSALL